ncbi:MAG TPA: YCF48-related protein [Mycobacteriales bacterium]
MRRTAFLGSLGALATGGLLFAMPASAVETVRRGWTPMPHCAPCGDAPRMTVVQFAGERTGWLAGGFGVARTDDGGTSWVLARGLPGPVGRASFAGSRGVAVGSFEGVAVSSDGGLTFTQYRPIPGKVYDVQALPDRLLAATASTLYSSTDGVVWKQAGRFAGGDTFGANLHFADAAHGTVSSAVQVATTHDGGRTWHDGVSHGYGTTIRTRAFTRDATHAYAVGVSGKGPSEYVLEASSDGGATFSKPAVPAAPTVYRGLSDVAFSGDTGYAVGWEGTLLRSTDAGASWVREEPPPSFERTTFKSVSVLSPDRAIAVTWNGGLVTRNAPAFTVTSHPYRGLGIALAGLGGLLLAGAGTRAVVARPDLVAGGLLAAGVVAAGSGVAAIGVSDDALPGVSAVAQEEDPGAGVALATGSPSATPSVTPSATPSVTPSLSPTPTPVRTTAAPTTAPPTSAPPTVLPTTLKPTATKAPGKFTVTPAALTQTCGPNGLPSFTVTLKNGTNAAVDWTMEFVEPDWASTGNAPAYGTVPAGATRTVTVYPNPQICQGMNQPTDYHLRVRQDTHAAVGGPVLGTVTDTVKPY